MEEEELEANLSATCTDGSTVSLDLQHCHLEVAEAVEVYSAVEVRCFLVDHCVQA